MYERPVRVFASKKIRLTSFFAFLRGLGLLGKAGVQPSGSLTIVTEIQRGKGASGAVKEHHIGHQLEIGK